MNNVFVHSYDAIHALGTDINIIVDNMITGVSGVQKHQDYNIQTDPFYAAKIAEGFKNTIISKYNTDIVTALTLEIADRLKATIPLPINDSKVKIILSSTKGNIDAIKDNKQTYPLLQLSKAIQEKLSLNYTPTVVATACISGLAAIIQAKRYLQHGAYKYVIVIGVDAFTNFTFKGFQSFHALADGICQPFDANRNGINLGECCAGIVLTNAPDINSSKKITITGTGLSNDANHLSGPSRTGNELAEAINCAINEANLKAQDIEITSTHGTATIYNDEMECKALHIANVAHAPVYSTKSYTGHTLGAAGVFETIIGIELLNRNFIIANKNFKSLGVPLPLNIIQKTQEYLHHNFLKTASGFGGCNAAIVVQKIS